MEETREQIRTSKKPGLAALFSVIPGVGYFYLGNALKGFGYFAGIAVSIAMFVSAVNRGLIMESIFFGLLFAGGYMYQIFDSYNEASSVPAKPQTAITAGDEPGEYTPPAPKEDRPSFIGSLIIFFIGCYFQLINLDYLELSDIDIVFPAIMILIGVSIILGRSNKGGNNE